MKRNLQVIAAISVYFSLSLFSLAYSDTLVGSIPGQFNVGSTGAAEYSIPIELPPGTAGVQPQLSLNYNSQGGNGLLGVGWSLGGLSVIHRCPANKAKDGFIDGVDFDSNDRFCLDGQPLVAINGVYGANNTEYRTEVDGFSKILSYGDTGSGPQYFKVWTKSGDIIEYGNSPNVPNDSLINPPLANGTSQPDALCWLLNKVTDGAGNYMSVTYFEDEATGENYPLRIDYTGNSLQSLIPYNFVVFEYEPKSDVTTKYIAGNKIVSTKRLKRIANNSSGADIREYRLSYEQNTGTNYSQINSVDMCDGLNNCTKTTNFQWKAPTSIGWTPSSQYQPPWPAFNVQTLNNGTGNGGWAELDYGTRYVDLNRDGLMDVVIARKNNSTANIKTAYLNTGNGWVAAPQYQPPGAAYNVTVVNNGTEGGWTALDYGTRYVDLNGDGLTDVLVAHKNTSTGNIKAAYLNTGNGWVAAPQYNPPGSAYNVTIFYNGTEGGWKSLDYGTRYVDINGDGLTDVLVAHKNTSTGNIKAAYLNTGNGWVAAPQYNPPGSAYNVSMLDNGTEGGWAELDYGTRYVDLNGDGLTDVLVAHKNTSTGNIKAAYLNTGNGWVIAPQFQPPGSAYNVTIFYNGTEGGWKSLDYGTRYVDLNGDGLTDVSIAHKNTSTGDIKTAYLNTGNGWVIAPQYHPPGPTYNVTMFNDGTGSGWKSLDYGTRYVDLNGDGLMDVVNARYYSSVSHNRNAYLNTGNGWVRETQYETAWPAFNVKIFNNGNEGGWKSHDYGTRYVDLNGDGLVDVVTAYYYDGTNNHRGAYLNTGKKGYIGKITNALDISIDIDYQPLTDASVYTKGNSAAYPEQDVQSSMYVVSQSRTDNAVGSQNTLNYNYAGAKAHLHGRGFLGFASRTVTDAVTGTTVETHFRQDFPFTGLVSSTETHFGSTLISKEVNSHAQVTTGTSTESGSTDPVFINADQSVAESFDLDTGALITTTTTTSSYDAYGNPTLITASTNDVGQPLFVTTTNNSYINDDSSKWHLGRLMTASVTKSLGGVASPTRRSAFEYDSVTGFLTKEIIEPVQANEPNMELMKTYVHDGYGNRVCVVTTGADITSVGNVNTCELNGTVIFPASAGRITTSSYDSQGRFAVAATNALGHTEMREYDSVLNKGWGQVTKLTGPNGLPTIWEYDTLGRKIKETRADGTISTISYTFCDSSNPCPALANSQVPSYFMTSTSDGAPLTKTYYDAVNRAVLTETESFDGSLVSMQTEFDARARVARTSLPYFGSTPNYWTVNTYDTLDRLTQENSPANGITTYSYDGLQTTVTNDLNQAMVEMKNSRGQTLWSDDEQGNRVSFTYDAAGNLTHVSDGTNTTINMYDLRGFKKTMDDPDMGQWSYAYNVLGELISQTNAKNQTTTMTYDVLGRLKTRDEPEGTTTWNYDTATKGIGKLASVTQYGGYSQTQSYDGLGRPSSSSTTINAIVHTTSNTYDSVGRVDEITYPTGFKVKQQYTSLGYLEKVVNAQTPSTEYWQAYGMDEFGNVTSAITGGIMSEHVYEGNSGRLKSINTGFTTVQNLKYQFDNLGNLTQRKDELQNKTENFLYDNLNRLTSAEVVGVGTKSFDYDAIGNIINKSDVGSYLYGDNTNGHAGPHAVTSTTGAVNATYVYDNNGNMQTGNGRTIAWSSYNKPIQITKGQGSAQKIVSFNYGPDRARYQQVATDNSTIKTTTYIGSLYEKVQTGSNIENKHYIRAGGQVIAIHNTYNTASDKTQYLHRDHLGSVDVITEIINGTPTVTERLSFDAFGQRRQATWQDAISQITSSITRGYTGHEQLDSVGLIHMNGRVYDPQLGRFLSADPFVQQPKNFQSLNRYTYVFNNPLSYTDPSGFFGIKSIKKAFKKVRKAINKAIKSVTKTLASAAGSILNTVNGIPVVGSAVQAAACTLGGPYGCAAYVAASTYAATGSLSASLTSGAIAFASAQITVSKTLSGGQKLVAHGAVGAVSAKVSGRNPIRGFAGGLFRTKFSSFGGRFDFYRNIIVGGTASVISGGKFKNGADAAAGGYLFAVGKAEYDKIHDPANYDPQKFVGMNRDEFFGRFDDAGVPRLFDDPYPATTYYDGNFVSDILTVTAAATAISTAPVSVPAAAAAYTNFIY